MLGILMFGICLAVTVMILLNAEGFLTRKGSFSGAGAAIVWPALPR